MAEDTVKHTDIDNTIAALLSACNEKHHSAAEVAAYTVAIKNLCEAKKWLAEDR